MNDKTRIVVTGIGVISCIGIGRDRFWKSAVEGRSGISRVTSFNTERYRTHNGAEIKDFDPFVFMNNPGKKGRAAQFLLSALKLAVKDAKLNLSCFDPSGLGIIVGMAAIESKIFEEITKVQISKGTRHIKSSLVARAVMRPSSAVAGCELNLKGPNIIISTACSSGNYAIGYGFDLLREGYAKIMFCGGADAFSRVIFTGFNRLFNVAHDKCRPFDKNRKGTIIGEGSAVLVLETLDGALKRKAMIYAEIMGYGLSCDASSMTIPSKDGIKNAIERAVINSGVSKKDVNYISAHGTGTVNNDKAEASAIREVFGPLADDIPVSSIKSMIGHALGAAGAIEAASCCLAIKESIVPPNINFDTPDTECNINIVANKAIKKKINVAINNSFAFGGNNACVVFGKLK